MFALFKKNNATIPVVKEIPAAAGTYTVGQTLALDANGNAAQVAGTKVTISTTFDSVTATSTNGVATIVEKLGSGASGTEVIVKF